MRRHATYLVRIGALLLAPLVAVALASCAGSHVSVVGVDAARVEVTLQGAAADSGVVTAVTLSDGQVLKVRAHLTGGPAVTVEVLAPETGEAQESLTITANDVATLAPPAGNHAVRVHAAQGATGTVSIGAEDA